MAITEINKRVIITQGFGLCMNPECKQYLLKSFSEDKMEIFVGEFAHINSKALNGPRANNLRNDLDEPQNVLLLCGSCHKMIDQNTREFNVEKLLSWKNNVKNNLLKKFDIPIFESRDKLRKRFENYIYENKVIFQNYGPASSGNLDIFTRKKEKWDEKCINTIIPNNNQIILLLDANITLLKNDEIMLLAKFKLHANGLIANKISKSLDPYAPLFPKEFENILGGN